MAINYGVIIGNDGKLYKCNPANSEYDIEISIVTDEELTSALGNKSDISHSHPTHGDINFTGTVSADGSQGLTGQRTIQGYTLTFKNGLLVGFQAP